MKSIKSLLLPFCAVLFFSCSSEDNEPTIPTIETMPIAEIVNADGTKYTAHEGYISYRSKENTVRKRIDFDYPKPITIDVGYGKKEEIRYRPFSFDDFGNKIALSIAPHIQDLNYQEEIFSQTSAFVFMADKDLTYIDKKKIQSGHICSENELILSFRNGLTYTLYNKDINEILQGKTTQLLEFPYTDGKLAKIDQHYYLAIGAKIKSKGTREVIINLNTGSVSELEEIPYEEIIKEHFAAETYPPQQESRTYDFIPGESGYLKMTLKFKLYNGSEKVINYKYNVNGKVIR